MSLPLYPDNPLDELKVGFDLDTPDGFKNYVRKTFKRFSCPGNLEEVQSHKAPIAQAEDFTESKTALTQPLQPFDENDNAYNFSNPRRGLAIIINNEDFSRSRDFGDRPGSSYDASSLYHSFRFLGFEVLPYENLTAWKMVEVLKAAALQYDHSKVDCFVCAILTHGDQIVTKQEWDRRGQDVRLDLLFGSDGKAIATKAIVEIFADTNCPTLKDKPRLFFLQACRGDKYDDGQTVLQLKPEQTISIHQGIQKRQDATDARDDRDANTNPSRPPTTYERQESLSSSVDPPKYHMVDTTDAVDEDDDDDDEKEIWEKQGSGDGGHSDKTDAIWPSIKDIPVCPTPIYKDFLIMYATPPGHFAWRRRTGAWFIQSLCKVIDSDLLTTVPLVRVLTRVCGMTAREYQSENPGNPAMHGKKEVPVLESMLVKDIFIPSRSRAVRGVNK